MRSQVRSTAAAALALAVFIPAATAYAEPSPQLPQTSPQTPQGQNSPQTPATPAPSAISPGSPGLAPSPPAGPATSGTGSSWGTGGSGTTGTGSGSGTVTPSVYNPGPPPGGWHAPRPTPDQPRPQWKPDTITLGNYEWKIKDLPPQLRKMALDNPRAIVSFNDWQSYAASQIARFLISTGMPKDQAYRQAAAAVIGAVVGGAAGGALAFTATAIVVGAVVIPIATLAGTAIGAGIGAAVPPQPFQAGPGALIGAGAGLATGVGITLAAALAAGLAGAIAAGTVGGAISWALGTGDPGKNLQAPDAPWAPHPEAPAPLPNPGGNQFEVHLPAPTASAVGLPGTNVNYVVNSVGDVNISGQIAGHDVAVGWTAAQAQAPIQALGALAPTATQAINDGVRSVADQATAALPGLEVAWPQLGPGKHRR